MTDTDGIRVYPHSAFKKISRKFFVEAHVMSEHTFFAEIYQTLSEEYVISWTKVLKDSLAGNSK